MASDNQSLNLALDDMLWRVKQQQQGEGGAGGAAAAAGGGAARKSGAGGGGGAAAAPQGSLVGQRIVVEWNRNEHYAGKVTVRFGAVCACCCGVARGCTCTMCSLVVVCSG